MTGVTVTLLDTERALVGALLAEPRTIIPVSGVLQQTDIADTLCRRVYEMCLFLAHSQVVPNPYTVAAAMPETSLDDLLALQSLANPQLVNQVLALAEVIRAEAVYRRVALVTATVATEAAARPPDLEKFTYDVVRRLGVATEGHADRASDMISIGKEVDALLAQESDEGSIPTGLDWLTGHIGGWKPGNIVGMVAPFKMRKSSLARNMILAAVRAHHQTCVYALEGSRTDLYLDLWAMLATRRLRLQLPGYEFDIEAVLDGMHLRNSLRTPTQNGALVSARTELDELTPYLHICDARDGINDLSRFNSRIRRDLFLHRTEIMFVDHLQLMSTGKGSLFENVEQTVGAIQRFATSEGVATVVLSQQNEAGIGVTDSYSPNVKGGGALAAACDHILTLNYDAERTPDVLTVRLKLSRRAQPGHRDYVINKSSGLVLSEAVV